MTERALLLRMTLRAEQDIFVIRQRGREVAAAVGLEHQDQIRLATALSDVARQLMAHGGADVSFVAQFGDSPRLVVELVTARQGSRLLREGDASVAVARLVDAMEVEDGESKSVVRMSRRLPPSAASLTARRIAEIRSDVAAAAPGTPLDELAVQNAELVSALDDVRHQRDELARLNAELEETNSGVLALYNELSQELEETNRGVVALYAELDEKSAQLKAASEAKSRFLANVSHELRAPVTAIIGLARLLGDPGSDPLTVEQSRQIDLIRGSATDLLTLVNDLLDLAKAESGRLEPNFTEVDLRVVLGQLRGTLRVLATRNDVRLVVADPEPGATLNTDEMLLVQVLRNLLTNALKFTDQGEVRLDVRRTTQPDGWELAISDTGIGIPAELHERIFEEFYQVPASRVGRAVGTGLGLPYARRVVTLLGGSLQLTSEPGRGSVFTVVLPRSRATIPGPPQPTAGPPQPTALASPVAPADFGAPVRGPGN